MPTANEELLDSAISHSVDFTRYNNGVVRRIIAILNRADKDLFEQLTAALDRLPAESFTVERLDMMLQSVRRLNESAYAALQSELQALEADREFLRRSNQGSEAMQQADQLRVRVIGTQRQWRNPEGVQTSFLSAEEMENLTIRSGTLTQAERDTINYHIVATIKMLETLPWPRHLKNVPEYAGGHHERMDDKGYPRGLTRAQMSWQARMIGVADVFEALTAADRPYKSGMKLSQALGIMQRMVHNGHIDPDLFDVFVQGKVYQRYAEQFLDPEQIDAVGASPSSA